MGGQPDIPTATNSDHQWRTHRHAARFPSVIRPACRNEQDRHSSHGVFSLVRRHGASESDGSLLAVETPIVFSRKVTEHGPHVGDDRLGRMLPVAGFDRPFPV